MGLSFSSFFDPLYKEISDPFNYLGTSTGSDGTTPIPVVGNDSDKGFNWGSFLGTSLPILGMGAMNMYGNYQNQKFNDERWQQQFDYQQQLDQDKMDFAREQLAAELEIAGIKAKIAKKQMIQKAYDSLVNATLQGGGMRASAMQGIGTMGQRPLIGG